MFAYISCRPQITIYTPENVEISQINQETVVEDRRLFQRILYPENLVVEIEPVGEGAWSIHSNRSLLQTSDGHFIVSGPECSSPL